MTTELKSGEVQTIIAASRIYGGLYVGDKMPVQQWWTKPTSTWFQTRLAELREQEKEDATNSLSTIR